MNATETAKAIKATKTIEELEAFATEHNIHEDERKTVQTAYQEHKESFQKDKAPKGKKAERTHGEVKDGTIYFKKKIPPTQPVNINGKRYMVLSDTIARDQSTGENLTIVTD